MSFFGSLENNFSNQLFIGLVEVSGVNLKFKYANEWQRNYSDGFKINTHTHCRKYLNTVGNSMFLDLQNV